MGTRKFMQQAKQVKSPVTMEEKNPFMALRNNIDRMFDSFFHGLGTVPFTPAPPSFYPSVDVTDSDKVIKVTLEMPGIDEKDIDISISGSSLTITGEKKEEKEEKGKNYHLMERVYGSFSRDIPLPVEVKADSAKATYSRGVLTVILPKTERSLKEVKKIPVKVK